MSDSPRYHDSHAWVELNELSDTELLTRLVAGDHSTLAVHFDRYHRLVFSVAVRILRDEDEAEDVVQAVFLNIFQDAAKFDPLKGTLKVWLLQYSYHRSINRRRIPVCLSSTGTEFAGQATRPIITVLPHVSVSRGMPFLPRNIHSPFAAASVSSSILASK